MTLAQATAARQTAEAAYAASKTPANLQAMKAAADAEMDLVVAGIDERAAEAAPAAPFAKILHAEEYGMRGTADRTSDWVTAHTLQAGHKKFDLTRVRWADGSTTIRVWQYNTTTLIHELHFAAK